MSPSPYRRHGPSDHGLQRGRLRLWAFPLSLADPRAQIAPSPDLLDGGRCGCLGAGLSDFSPFLLASGEAGHAYNWEEGQDHGGGSDFHDDDDNHEQETLEDTEGDKRGLAASSAVSLSLHSTPHPILSVWKNSYLE
jgi:hypothetical protein